MEFREHEVTVNLKVIVWQDETGWFVAECPALPGCVSQGRTEEEALANIRDAIIGWLEVSHERGIQEWQETEAKEKVEG
jgi:predicted RNase H-like HicB family nuclease